jgi:hypothetical protein
MNKIFVIAYVTLWLTVRSVYLGVKPTLWTFDHILLPFQEFAPRICYPVSVERPLWREAGPVLCKSQSSHLSVCTSRIYIFVFHTFTIYIHYTIYIIYTRPLLVPARYSRLFPTLTSSSRHNSSLDTWTVLNITAAKFKPLVFPIIYVCVQKYGLIFDERFSLSLLQRSFSRGISTLSRHQGHCASFVTTL